ncbi:FMN-dependent NADH-azoreductase [Spiroplasma turonicum]|uniref:FMN dependent NADH:quinone oxidoreductase n=1 Tax=Spiroplasma turonicum TaxID=216946 RepID=A0A0K1P5M3_9MOLU|nr:FMN-dependent NADH-azoreductase [Spiroplasma turonicum]AKU79626.1 azoreductase [Spiroplasma turonicum]ALX70647.1 azoreductase [Spiroplasma turonicum]
MANKVLVISGTVSPVDKSYSLELTNQFIEEYKKNNSNDEFIYLDLNNEEMAKKTLSRDNFSSFFNENDAIKYINQLKEVNKVIISSPMNNFNVSALIKNYLDHVLLADQSFSYKYSKKDGSVGLLDHLSVQILTTQGAPLGWYPFGNHTEFLKGTWEFVGAKVNEPILFAGTKVKPTSELTPKEAINTISDKIKEVAAKF